MARKQVEFPIGERLPGTKYVVVKKLGQGGMGVVVEVVKEPGIRGVAKIIHPDLAADPDFRRRFFDEVRILAKLDHPNIVRVTDYDQLEDGTPYFVMELLTGNTLRQVFRTRSVQPSHLYQIMRGLLEGLSYVHTHDPPIVHRDIKTENVFIHLPTHGDPCIKVIDFGVAGGEAIVEEKGLFVGTPGYAAPEQLRGKPVTPQADLYSAALILYEGLAGRGPFDDVPLVRSDDGSRQKALIRAHLGMTPPSVLTFAPWAGDVLDKLLQSALSKDPRDRPQSAYVFATQLYMLQFLGPDAFAEGMGNATVPTLETMTQAPPASDRGPVAPRSPTTREERPRHGPNDTVVDSSPAGLADLLDVARDEDDIVTVNHGAVARNDGEVAEVLAAPLQAAHPTPPRSFAEAEAAVKRQSYDFAPRRPSEPPGRAGDLQAVTDAGTTRAMRSKVQPSAPAAGVRDWRFWALALGIPLVVVVAFALVERFRGHEAAPAAESPPPANPAPVIAPLPPEDPPERAAPAASPSGVPASSSASGVPARVR